VRNADYFVGSRYLGRSSVLDEAYSLAFFCPVCGEVWGRVVVEGAAQWSLTQNACERHLNFVIYTHGQPPGSLLTPSGATALEAWAGSAGLLKNFPPAAVEREFLIHFPPTESAA
jgi:hypothetical protein